ncbi:ggt [Symbiodinium natans]|uniref:Ggt protein n=1 Tax=Symbiodinium natans TaxID=878477 RepID=A0A812QRG8_9DINO|nr:ggt [Symbiodinium natans]
MAVAASEEWVGEDICLFPCEDIEPEPGEALGHEQFDVELMKACCVHVGPHQVKLYMAKQRADDLSPDDLGLRIWPGTHAMAFLLLGLERQGALAGRSVLDVGCGTGFIGILAQKAGCAESVLSDRPGRALSTARINALANSGRDPDTIQVRELSWGPGSVDETEGAVYSLLLLSEVLYVAQPTCVPWSLDEEDVEALAKLTKLKLSPEGDAYITYGNREAGGTELVQAVAEAVGLSFRELPLDSIVPEEVLEGPHTVALRRVRVFHLRYLIEQFDYFSTMVSDYKYAEKLCYNRTRTFNDTRVKCENLFQEHGDITAECESERVTQSTDDLFGPFLFFAADFSSESITYRMLSSPRHVRPTHLFLISVSAPMNIFQGRVFARTQLANADGVYGSRGMVATSQPLASEAGMRILQAGGTAADACVAAAAALNVTEPCNTGIGGDAFALYYNAATQQVECLQGCGRSPAALTLEAVRRHPDMAGGRADLPPLSALCVTVPGAAAAWESAVQRWGKLSLRQVLAPAIELATDGELRFELPLFVPTFRCICASVLVLASQWPFGCMRFADSRFGLIA